MSSAWFRRVAAAAALLLAAGVPALAQAQACTRFPRADAGESVQDCIPAVGTTDYALSASRSSSQPLNGPIVSYCWSTDYGTFTSSGAATACGPNTDVTLRVPNTPGHTIIRVRVVVTDVAGCSDDDEITLDLSTAPVVTRAEAATADICLGQPLDLLAAAVNTFAVDGLVEYRWDVDVSLDRDANGFPDDDADAVLTGVSGRLVVASAQPPRAGRYTARLTAIVAGNACNAVADVSYLVQEPPVVRLVVGPAITCPNQQGEFRAELAFGDAGSDLTWDFDVSVDSDGDGDPANDVEASGNSATHAFPESGIRRIRVTAVGTNGCKGFTEKDTVVRTAPVPAFTTSGPGCGPLAVTFTDRSTGAGPLVVSWDFGDGSAVESGLTRTHVFPSPGSYRVSHVVTDVEGCLTSESRLVEVMPSAAVVEGVTLLDGQPGTGSSGNADGFADPGERIRLVAEIRNTGSSFTEDLVASLSTTDTEARLAITEPEAEVAPLLPGATGTTLDPHLEALVALSAPCGSSVPVEVSVTGAGAGACVSTLPLSLRVGAPELTLLGGELGLTGSNGRADVADAVFAAGAHAVLVLDSTSGVTRVLLVRRGPTGLPLGEATLLDDVPGADASAAQVAWSAGLAQVAAAWIATEGVATQGVSPMAVRWRRVDSGGHPIGSSRRLDLSGRAGTVDLAWAGDHWLVAWTDRATPASPAQLVAQVVTADGLPLGSPLPLGTASADDGAVRVAASGGRVLVAHRVGGELRLFVVEGLRPASVLRQEVLSDAGGTPSVHRSGAGFVVAFESGTGIDLAWLPVTGATSRSTVVPAGASPALAAAADLRVLAYLAGNEVHALLAGTSGASSDPVRVTAGPALPPALSATPDGLFLAEWSAPSGIGNVVVRAGLIGPAPADGCSSGVQGDVAPQPDGDGIVNVSDVVLVLRVAVGLEDPTPEILARGDVAPGERTGSLHRVVGDGRIDVADAVVLLQASAGLVTIVP